MLLILPLRTSVSLLVANLLLIFNVLYESHITIVCLTLLESHVMIPHSRFAMVKLWKPVLYWNTDRACPSDENF